MDGTGTREPDHVGELPDVTGDSLPALLSTDESVLANALRRWHDERGGDEEIVAGHSDAVQ